MKYVVWIVRPPGYPHSPGAFMEVAIGLRDGLIDLGHEAEISTQHPPYGYAEPVYIILGANLLHYTCLPIPDNSIIYNLEQITQNSPWITFQYLDLLKTHTVWDYCHSNIEELEKLGIAATLCPIGYAPALTCIPDLTHESWLNDQPLDVLFYGSVNARRQKIYDELKHACNCHWAFGVYGKKRDALIARAKIVVNIHFYESKIHEIVRTSYLMANSKCVVSETGNDKDLEGPYYDAMAFSGYDDICGRVLGLLENHDERARISRSAFATFSRTMQSTCLEPVVGRVS